MSKRTQSNSWKGQMKTAKQLQSELTALASKWKSQHANLADDEADMLLSCLNELLAIIKK